ncbi:hypothetical protein [uncultured Thiodictyon sp.]|uniref:hypothetical protein n=1 Tax=uncultured Thiodictyon sp. TaxID=1846217 RepID=UPI0025CE2189|nr:hypothetical protein [uncultured Thiodictyon sp.]
MRKILSILLIPPAGGASALIMVSATRHRRVDKRSAVHQRRRGIRWTALSLVDPTAGTMIKAGASFDAWRASRGSSV